MFLANVCRNNLLVLQRTKFLIYSNVSDSSIYVKASVFQKGFYQSLEKLITGGAAFVHASIIVTKI